MAEKPIRVRVDLTEVDLLPYKYVWVPVSWQELRTIEDFKSTLYQKFNFVRDKKIKLFVQDSLLLDKDTVLMLREDDTVKVIYEDQFLLNTSVDVVKKIKKSKRKKDCDAETLMPSSSSIVFEDKFAVAFNADSNISDAKKVKSRNSKRSNEECDADWPLWGQNKRKKGSKISESSTILELNSVGNASSSTLHRNNCERIAITNATEDEACEKVSKKKKKIKHEISDPDDSKFTNAVFKETKYSKPSSLEKSQKLELLINKVLSSPQKPCLSKEGSVGLCVSREESTEVLQGLVSGKQISPCTSSVNFLESPSVKHETSFEKESEQKTAVLQGNNCRKKKRKRRKKRKALIDPVNYVPCVVNMNENQCLELNTFQSHQLSNNPTSVPKHIVFTEKSVSSECESDKADKDIYKKASIVNLDSYLNNFKPNGMADKTFNSSQSNANGKSETYTFEGPKMSATPANHIDQQLNWWSMTSLKKPLQEQLPLINPNKATPIGGETEKDSYVKYAELPVLNSLPSVGTHIVYKVLELSDLYCPEVSDYKEGIIKRIDPHTDELEIELLKEEVENGRTGKFENLYPDEVPDSKIIKNIKISWASLIEPKAVSY